MKPAWKMALFDFDGVLFDSSRVAMEVVDELREEPRFSSLPSPTESGHFGCLYRGVLRDALFAHGLDTHASRAFFDAHASRMRERQGEVRLFAGVAAAIGNLDPCQFGIITSSYGSVVVNAFARDGVSLQPEQVVGHEVRATKTDKIHDYLRQHEVTADQAVYVGDMESDVLYCREVPIDCVAVSYGYHPSALLESSDAVAVCTSPTELFDLLGETLS